MAQTQKTARITPEQALKFCLEHSDTPETEQVLAMIPDHAAEIRDLVTLHEKLQRIFRSTLHPELRDAVNLNWTSFRQSQQSGPNPPATQAGSPHSVGEDQ